MKHQAMMEELRVINEKTDVVVRALGLTSADTGKWKKQYEDDQRIHRELLASSVDNAQEVLAELQDARSQQETMLTLKYEVELRPEQQDAEMTKLLRTMMATVIRTSTTSVPKLPPWFLPPYEIRFDPKPFARGSFATVHRGAVIGEPPFALLDDDSVHEKLRNGEIPEKPEKMSAEVWELVAAMTNVDPTKRISLSRVLKTLKDFADGNLRSPPQAANPASELTENANLALVDTEIIVGILDNVSAMDDQAKEQSMLQLVRICVEDEERPVMYEADAIQILTNLVKSGRNNYTKLYALQCLKWAAVVDAKLPKLAFDSLRDSVPEIPAKELAFVVNALTNGTDQEKEDAAVRCACIATRGTGGLLREVALLQPLVALWQSMSEAQKLWIGMVQPLVSLMRNGNDAHKLLAAEAIGSLATENEAIRAEIVRADAITPLVDLLRVGSNGQKQRASHALKNLALQIGVSQKIVQMGAISPLLGLVRIGTTQQKQTTTDLLGSLVLPNYPNRPDIECETSIPPLVALILVGSAEQKETAAGVLVDLAQHDYETPSEIARVGGIAPLVGLLATGTNAQKGYAASALMKLSSNVEVSVEISHEGGVALLVDLARKGNDQQKTSAVGALANLAFNDSIGAEIARCKGVGALVVLMRTGTEQQKDFAVDALQNLAVSDEIGAEIAREGGIEPLIKLIRLGTDQQKEGAVGALANLSINDAVRSEILSKGGVAALLELLRMGTDELNEKIAGALGNFANSDEGRTEIAREGGIAPLVALLRAGSEQQKGYATDTIRNLAKSNDKIRAELVREGTVPLLKNLSRSGSERQKESAARALQQLNGGCCILM
ncbi:hypothetical protein PF008_g12168 [Phytophthora fragariae]|uniref:U-box domain-containing protein n=2 Tax=Phytophthora fragariae TaxID=53985 RepID=A0A6G0RP81_9STRA|nr:hypothetical protein PF008_g12168 [Phytophthora fragariae]